MSEANNNNQIYSATYSNVPVFEFVTVEGPIMRRKLDSWINATHILKIAKLPKAKRTRILEKDVQTNTHEKVQGGYGKYQGTYVPLSIGENIAKNFNVYEILRPIFEFTYIEGETETPPPAPKHNHASALNVAKRQASLTKKLEVKPKIPKQSKRVSLNPDDAPRKRGRPKGSTLSSTPSLQNSDTVPLNDHLPYLSNGVPRLNRQDTVQDNLPNLMVSNMSLRQEDLDSVGTDDDEEYDHRKGHKGSASLKRHKSNGAGSRSIMNGMDTFDQQNELLTSKELFGVSRNIYEKNAAAATGAAAVNTNAQQNDFLQPYHQPSINLTQENQIYNEYFGNLLTFFLEDDGNDRSKAANSENIIPETLRNPPQPISKVHINQPIDQDGNTIFHWACAMGNTTMINFLYEKFKSEIKSDIRNNKGETPLMFLVRFNNSYQLNNFDIILTHLIDSLNSVDSTGKNVLHHIVENKKEKISAYYLQILLQEFMSSVLGKDINVIENISEDKLSIINGFINHQDSDGNTAFHIAAYHLLKKIIKLFINYHQFISFGLRNLVNTTVEEYLASHNFVLRLDQTAQDDDQLMDENERIVSNFDENEVLQSKNGIVEDNIFDKTSFDAQLHKSKLAINLYNNTANLLTEKMTQLSYVINQELNDKDETVLNYFKTLKIVNQIKLESQRAILSFFNLESLINNLEENEEHNNDDDQSSFKNFKENEPHSQGSTQRIPNSNHVHSVGANYDNFNLKLNFEKDRIIQEEVYRLINDVTFQVIHQEENLRNVLNKINNFQEFQNKKYLKHYNGEGNESHAIKNENNSEVTDDQLNLALELQNQIIKKQTLVKQIFNQRLGSTNSKQPPVQTGIGVAKKENKSIISNIMERDPNNKILKYCKLISLSCGMRIDEVENNIDVIEQSLIMRK
ncbi:MBP1 [Candida pseudojiufengensis]|uniref:MBP1 n=1 Tax=Candida pseudojiufengensis TaxID=497109 RepID=UPI0022256241|nr:MBP1 [Candida pseudojiufengensis]KAI5960426.1 MBP1 [Candida pseudojiufengensis]